MTINYSKISLSTLETVAEINLPHFPKEFAKENLTQIRQEIKLRKINAEKLLDNLETLEYAIEAGIMKSLREKAFEGKVSINQIREAFWLEEI